MQSKIIAVQDVGPQLTFMYVTISVHLYVSLPQRLVFGKTWIDLTIIALSLLTQPGEEGFTSKRSTRLSIFLRSDCNTSHAKSDAGVSKSLHHDASRPKSGRATADTGAYRLPTDLYRPQLTSE